MNNKAKIQVLVLFYSFSSQTRNILYSMVEGLMDEDVEVIWVPIYPKQRLRFPIGSYTGTVKAMMTTFFRQRIRIVPMKRKLQRKWDLVILGGPTWSFQPSGPILSLIDEEKDKLLAGQNILPVISSRYFWKQNYNSLKSMLKNSGSQLLPPVVVTHPIKEPWCTIGLFLKLAGKVPESEKSWLSRFYPKYGHTKEQILLARQMGGHIGRILRNGELEKFSPAIPLRLEEES